MVGLPARSAGKFGAFSHHLQGSSAKKFGAFYSVSGEIPARSAGKFWGTCVASVKFCNLVFNDLALSYTYRSVGDTPTRGRKALRGTFLSV